jgi:undecaprenyl-diphosphatase
MGELWAIIYGIIQGLTEFLPISSSGHLALIPYFSADVEDPGVFFDLLMHVGTAFAVMIYFWRDVLKLIKGVLNFLKGDRQSAEALYAGNFIIATIASVIMILLMKDTALSMGRNAKLIAFNLIFFGTLMFISDLKKPWDVSMSTQSHLKKAILIGLSQAIAIFPGVSRSGITLTSGRFLGLSREEATRFSFLLSLPIILASIVYKIPAIATGEAISESMMVMFLGVFVSFIVGFITIHFFLKAIKRIGLSWFFYYRVILGIIILVS